MMPVMRRLRSYHTILAILVVLAYITGDDNAFHAWLGYGVATIVIVRLIWAMTGVPQLGLMRFYPHFKGLHLISAMTHPAISRTLLMGIATCLIGVTLTGIVMDRGHAFGRLEQSIGGPALEGSTQEIDRETLEGHDDDEDESLIGEAHEALASLLMLLILTHVTYLLLFKRPLALFMLFFQTPVKREP